jgi:hypothetical protein
MALEEGAFEKYQNEWEQTRFIGWCAIRGHFKVTPEELMPFNWENKKQNKGDFINKNIKKFDELFPKTLK